MKIAIIFPSTIDTNDFGGMHRVISMLAKYFSVSNDDVVMIFLNTKFYYPCSGEIIELGIKVSSCFVGKMCKAFLKLYKLNRLLKLKNFDIIYNLFWLTPLLSHRLRKKMVSAIHSDPFSFSWLFRFISRTVLPLSNLVIVPSKLIAKLMCDKWAITNVISIYNPLDLEYICRESEFWAIKCFSKPYILSAGRLSLEKNFKLLINAYNLTKCKNEIFLLILGEGLERKELEFLVKINNLEGRVFLMGIQKNPFAFMKKSLFFVSSSLTEALPMAIIEALSCGSPVISTDWSSAPEIIQHGKNGLLVKNGDALDLANAIDRLYFDVEFRKQCSINAHRSIEKFSYDTIMKRYREIFESIVKKNIDDFTGVKKP